jgi:SpoVK/Ycf46/Vps4 family AAA+-type ATPase
VAVHETVRYNSKLAVATDRPADAAVVLEAARRVGGAHGARTGPTPLSTIGGGPTFNDLILPDDVAADLRRMAAWGRHRNDVTANGPLNRRGISALFAGSPGTGKTLAAHVLAEELALDLFQVEVATVVDKYIGETEKNLEKIFLAAESLDVVLFFDEADALFGSRSEVRNAHDRYANQEIAYLLQRMEQFDGITILATNLRGNLDPAFSRRMSFIVHFPDPDPDTRRRLWDYHLAQLSGMDPRDPVEVERLAVQVEASGGDIRNIVRAAAYDALSAQEPVGMRHIVSATVHEFRKLGKLLPAGGDWRSS